LDHHDYQSFLKASLGKKTANQMGLICLMAIAIDKRKTGYKGSNEE
jgi:hypothetical protein